MHIKTMAVKITEKTYPVATACLGAWFMMRPMRSVLGSYLVINEVVALDSDDLHKSLAMKNMLYDVESFSDRFEFVDGELKTNFAEVRHL